MRGSWLGQQATRSADLYALGGILCEMLTGEPPFPGPDRSIATGEGLLVAVTADGTCYAGTHFSRTLTWPNWSQLPPL